MAPINSKTVPIPTSIEPTYSTPPQDRRQGILSKPHPFPGSPDILKSNGVPMPNSQVYLKVHKQLLQEGCTVAAKYFKKLVTKEIEYVHSQPQQLKCVCDTSSLLHAIVDNIKTAEHSYNQNADKDLILKLLLQTVHMIHSFDQSFLWLVKEIYALILHLCGKWESECPEMFAKIRFDYGVVLLGFDINEAVFHLSKSLDLCADSKWSISSKNPDLLQHHVCRALCDAHLHLADMESANSLEKAAKLAAKAHMTIKRSFGIPNNGSVGELLVPEMYYVSLFSQAEYMMSGHNYKGAITNLKVICNISPSNDNVRYVTEGYFLLSVCYSQLKAFKTAVDLLNEMLRVSTKFNLYDFKAQALVHLGKLYVQGPKKEEVARTLFMEARNAYRNLEGCEREILARYLTSKSIPAQRNSPITCAMLSRSAWDKFCYICNVVLSKSANVPRWT